MIRRGGGRRETLSNKEKKDIETYSRPIVKVQKSNNVVSNFKPPDPTSPPIHHEKSFEYETETHT